MHFKVILYAVLGLFITSGAWAQNEPAQDHTVPVYRVTVVERTIRAVNYQYRTGPTQIDFRGTVLMPQARGDATVESKAGRTEIDAKFDHVDSPERYGHEYLAYVLWAVTPDGHAKNLGEVVTNHSDKGHLRVTTDLQAFGLLVTAEPYAAVRLPSDVVVMENQVRPDTIGETQPINIKYELMPRGAYTYNVPVNPQAAGGPRVSMDRYESLLELYQAQNAVQIAQSQGAEKYAPEIFTRAESQLQNAQQLDAQRASRSQVVTAARQAAETAEDARSVAVQRQHDRELAEARDQASVERDRRMEAEATAQKAQAEAAAAHQTLEAERTARQQAEAMAQAATSAPAAPPPLTQPAVEPSGSAYRMDMRQEDQEKLNLRVNLLQQFNGTLAARDTPRGLVVTVPDPDFRGGSLNPAFDSTLMRIAAILETHPGLMVEVEGNTDSAGVEPEAIARERAEAVRMALIRGGLRPDGVMARSLGNSRLIASNASPSGHQQNRRVEIVVSGSAIGSLPYWDKPYALNPR